MLSAWARLLINSIWAQSKWEGGETQSGRRAQFFFNESFWRNPLGGGDRDNIRGPDWDHQESISLYRRALSVQYLKPRGDNLWMQ